MPSKGERMKRRSREYRVRHEHADDGILVRAGSFLGAMRAAFGPGVYKEIGGDNGCRRIQWEFGPLCEPPKINNVGPYQSTYVVTVESE